MEDPADKLRGHADAGVMNPDHQVRRVVMEHHLPDGHDDLALIGKLHCVGQKIDDDLLQAQGVPHQSVHGHILKIDLISDAPVGQGLGEHLLQFVPHGPEAEGLIFQLNLVRFNPGHIQNVVNEGEQMLRKSIRPAEIFHSRVLRCQLLLRQSKHTDDAVHGGTDFMGHPGQEGGLGLAGVFHFCQPGLIIILGLLQVRNVPQPQQVVRRIGAGLRIEVEAHTIPAAHIQIQPFLPVPGVVGLPDTAVSRVQTVVQPGNVRLQFLQVRIQQAPQIADGIHGHGIRPADQQDALLTGALRFLQENLLFPSPLVLLFTAPGRHHRQRNCRGGFRTGYGCHPCAWVR